MRERKGEGRKGKNFRSRMSVHRIQHETSMWANMRIIVLNSLKVGVTRSLRTRQNAELRNNYTTYINFQGAPPCKRSGCVHTLRTPPPPPCLRACVPRSLRLLLDDGSARSDTLDTVDWYSTLSSPDSCLVAI